MLGGGTRKALRGNGSVALTNSGGKGRARGEGGREGGSRAMVRDGDRRAVRVVDGPVLRGSTREALRDGRSVALASSGGKGRARGEGRREGTRNHGSWRVGWEPVYWPGARELLGCDTLVPYSLTRLYEVRSYFLDYLLFYMVLMNF
jgi:hypothetical protein